MQGRNGRPWLSRSYGRSVARAHSHREDPVLPLGIQLNLANVFTFCATCWRMYLTRTRRVIKLSLSQVFFGETMDSLHSVVRGASREGKSLGQLSERHVSHSLWLTCGLSCCSL
jgi:hypothetical protein